MQSINSGTSGIDTGLRLLGSADNYIVAVRVVAGIARGRTISTPKDRNVRPTSDRVREAMFNALHSLDAVRGVRVLDLFAGTGALGIEALSRGASHVTFVESDSAARQLVIKNLAQLGFDDAEQAAVIAGSAQVFLERKVAAVFDLVLLDPPYAFDEWDQLLGSLEPWCDNETILVIESNRKISVPPEWKIHRSKRYGGTVVSIHVRATSMSHTSGANP